MAIDSVMRERFESALSAFWIHGVGWPFSVPHVEQAYQFVEQYRREYPCLDFWLSAPTKGESEGKLLLLVRLRT